MGHASPGPSWAPRSPIAIGSPWRRMRRPTGVMYFHTVSPLGVTSTSPPPLLTDADQRVAVRKPLRPAHAVRQKLARWRRGVFPRTARAGPMRGRASAAGAPQGRQPLGKHGAITYQATSTTEEWSRWMPVNSQPLLKTRMLPAPGPALIQRTWWCQNRRWSAAVPAGRRAGCPSGTADRRPRPRAAAPSPGLAEAPRHHEVRRRHAWPSRASAAASACNRLSTKGSHSWLRWIQPWTVKRASSCASDSLRTGSTSW